VVPGHTGRGVASLLAYHAYRAALRRGVHTALLCLIRDGNPSTALAGGAGRVFREYALYGRTTDE
jgi:L-amino acid N-acyltransferase YncA